MRVLHLSADKLYGGIETMLATFARERDLCPEMSPSFALCFRGRLSAELAETGAPTHTLGEVRLSRFWTVAAARRALGSVIARSKPDVVVCHEAWPHVVLAPAVRRSGVPLAFWMHGFHATAARTSLPALDRWASRTKPDLVLANSHATKGTAAALFPRVPAVVVHCPVVARGPVGATAAAANRQAIRSELATPADAVVFVQACRLEPWKGHALFLQALARLARPEDADTRATRPTSWIAWIAGGAQRPAEEAYLAELRAMAQRLGIAERVRFLGQRTDVPNLLAAADVHCQPNAGPEPFGIAFVEAMLAGLPVVTTAIGAAPEIVEAASGILVRPDDPAALAVALRGLLDDPEARRRLGDGGPARAHALCDPAVQLAALSRELRALIPSPA